MIKVVRILVLGLGICAGIIYTLVADQNHETVAESIKAKSIGEDPSDEAIFIERTIGLHRAIVSRKLLTQQAVK